MDLLLSESLESVASQTFDELRRKEAPETEDGIVEPKAIDGSTVAKGAILAAIVFTSLLLLATLVSSPKA